MKKLSASEIAAKEIKADILSGGYRVGDKYLPEVELCGKLGVSRTTVREAMKLLQAVGMLELKPGRGAFVAICEEAGLNEHAIDRVFSGKDDFTELSEVRMGIEPTTAKYAAERAVEDEIFKLFGILEFFEKAYEANDVLGMVNADEKFHNAIASAAHNALYCKLYEQMTSALRECKGGLFSVANNGKAAVQEHRAMAEAIAEHDGGKAFEAMETHIRNISANIAAIADERS